MLCDERKFTRLPHHLWCHCCRIEELLGDFERAELIASKDSVVLHLRETWVQVSLLGSVGSRWNEIRIAPDKGERVGYGIQARDTGYSDIRMRDTGDGKRETGNLLGCGYGILGTGYGTMGCGINKVRDALMRLLFLFGHHPLCHHGLEADLL